LKATIDALQTNAVPFVVLYSARWPSGEYDAGILTVWPSIPWQALKASPDLRAFGSRPDTCNILATENERFRKEDSSQMV